VGGGQSDKLYFTKPEPGFPHVNMEVADSANWQGRRKTDRESSNVWMSQKPVRLVENGKELLWWSEREDGGTCTCMTDREAEEPDYQRRNT